MRFTDAVYCSLAPLLLSTSSSLCGTRTSPLQCAVPGQQRCRVQLELYMWQMQMSESPFFPK